MKQTLDECTANSNVDASRAFSKLATQLSLNGPKCFTSLNGPQRILDSLSVPRSREIGMQAEAILCEHILGPILATCPYAVGAQQEKVALSLLGIFRTQWQAQSWKSLVANLLLHLIVKSSVCARAVAEADGIVAIMKWYTNSTLFKDYRQKCLAGAMAMARLHPSFAQQLADCQCVDALVSLYNDNSFRDWRESVEGIADLSLVGDSIAVLAPCAFDEQRKTFITMQHLAGEALCWAVGKRTIQAESTSEVFRSKLLDEAVTSLLRALQALQVSSAASTASAASASAASASAASASAAASTASAASTALAPQRHVPYQHCVLTILNSISSWQPEVVRQALSLMQTLPSNQDHLSRGQLFWKLAQSHTDVGVRLHAWKLLHDFIEKCGRRIVLAGSTHRVAISILEAATTEFTMQSASKRSRQNFDSALMAVLGVTSIGPMQFVEAGGVKALLACISAMTSNKARFLSALSQDKTKYVSLGARYVDVLKPFVAWKSNDVFLAEFLHCQGIEVVKSIYDGGFRYDAQALIDELLEAAYPYQAAVDKVQRMELELEQARIQIKQHEQDQVAAKKRYTDQLTSLFSAVRDIAAATDCKASTADSTTASTTDSTAASTSDITTTASKAS